MALSHVQLPKTLLKIFNHTKKEITNGFPTEMSYVYYLDLNDYYIGEEKTKDFNTIQDYYDDNGEIFLSTEIENKMTPLIKKLISRSYTDSQLTNDDRKLIKTIFKYGFFRSKELINRVLNNPYVRSRGKTTKSDVIISAKDTGSIFDEYNICIIKNKTKKDFVLPCNYVVPLKNLLFDTALFMAITPKCGIVLTKDQCVCKDGLMELTNLSDVKLINTISTNNEMRNLKLIVASRKETLEEVLIDTGHEIRYKKEDA